MKTYEAPTVKRGEDGSETYHHPAYGLIMMTVATGGSDALFGSDIGHHQKVRIMVKRARHHRDLSNDWYHANGPSLIEFEMSHAQFSEFLTSAGKGDGTPVTLARIDGEIIPGIERAETKNNLLRRELRAAAEKRMKIAGDVLEELDALATSGKAGKTALRDLHKRLADALRSMPGSVDFILEQAEEALEKATTHAKVEIEATVHHHVQRMGLEAARKIGIVAPDYQPPKEIT